MAQPQLVWDSDEGDIVLLSGDKRSSRLAALFAYEHDRYILWTPVLFATGIGVYFALPFEPLLYPLLLCLGLSMCAVFPARHSPVWKAVSLALCLFLSGLSIAKWRTSAVDAPVLHQEIGPIWIEGVAKRVETIERDDIRLTLHPDMMEDVKARDYPHRVRVTVRTDSPDIRAGDKVRLRAVLSPPAEPASPDAFDFARQAYFQGLGGLGYAVSVPTVLKRHKSIIEYGIERQRATLAERITRRIDGDAGAIAAALLVGERGALSDQTANAFRNAGLAHLLAISGLHFGLVAAALFFIARVALALIPYAALNWPIKEAAAVLAWMGTLFYLVITGAPLPAQRAFIMTSVILLALILGRQPISLRLAGFAAFVVLLLRPEALLSVSFQMSFAAVVGLIAAYEAVREKTTLFAPKDGKQWARKATLYFFSVAISTIVAEVAIDPIAAYHFNHIARYGLFANLVAVPLTAFWIMPWGLFAMFLMPFGLEAIALIPMGWGIDVLMQTATTTAQAPGAVWIVKSFPTAALIAMIVGGLWLCLWRGKVRLIGLSGPVFGLFLAFQADTPDMIIANDANMIAMKDAEGRLYLTTKRGSRITKETWMRRSGEREARYWLDDPAFVERHRVRCDDLGCAFHFKGQTFAFTEHIAAIEDDCRKVDVIITPLSVKTCQPQAVLIDQVALHKGGSHALYAPVKEGGKWVFITANSKRGARPWVRGLAP